MPAEHRRGAKGYESSPTAWVEPGLSPGWSWAGAGAGAGAGLGLGLGWSRNLGSGLLGSLIGSVVPFREVVVAAGSRRERHQVTFAVLALGIGAFALLQSLVVPVLTTVQHQLHTSQDTVTWVLTGSLLAALAPSIGVMIVARVIQGAGGGMLPVAFGIIRDEFPPGKVAGAVGVLAALTAVGAGLGIVLAGPIVDALDYHWLFWLPLILTVVAAVAAVLLVPESPVRTPGRISWLPAVLLSGWLVALLVALSEAPVWGWGSSRVIGLLAGAVVLAVAWVAAELRAATPLIDMTMMRRTAVWTNNLVALLIGVGMYATFAFLPEFVQTPAAAGYGFGASITRSGLMLLPSTITMFAVGMFAGRLTRALGGKVLVIAGCLIGCGAMAILAFAHAYEWEIYLSNAIMGIGFGLAFRPCRRWWWPPCRPRRPVSRAA